MTIGELIQFLEANQYYTLYFFVAVPLGALLANYFGKGEGELNPWCSFYAALIYLSVIPGVFSILLNLYHLLFENTSIYNVNINVQILPIVSMVLSLYFIKQNVSFDSIPGFGKVTGFASRMAGIMVVFFFLDKARLIAFTYIPFIWVIILLLLVYLVIRYGSRFFLKN